MMKQDANSTALNIFGTGNQIRDLRLRMFDKS
jgi:hypothetical protein